MIFKVDPSNSIPVYAQIITQVKHAVASGVIRQGEFLPSLRDTAVNLRINPHTVAKAYKELEMMGLVKTDHGKGTYVAGNWPGFSKEYQQAELQRLADQFVVEAYHLKASPDEILELIKQKLDQMSSEFKIRDGKQGDLR